MNLGRKYSPASLSSEYRRHRKGKGVSICLHWPLKLLLPYRAQHVKGISWSKEDIRYIGDIPYTVSTMTIRPEHGYLNSHCHKTKKLSCKEHTCTAAHDWREERIAKNVSRFPAPAVVTECPIRGATNMYIRIIRYTTVEALKVRYEYDLTKQNFKLSNPQQQYLCLQVSNRT